VVCDLDRPEARLDRPVLTGCIIVRSDWAASVDQRAGLTCTGAFTCPGGAGFATSRALGHNAPSLGRSGGQSSFVFRVPSVRPEWCGSAPRSADRGRRPSPSSSSSPARSMAYYLLTYFLLPIFLRRCEESQPAATGEQARGLRSSICRLHNEWWLLLLLWRANMTMQLAGFSMRLPAYSFLFFLLPGVNVFSVES